MAKTSRNNDTTATTAPGAAPDAAPTPAPEPAPTQIIEPPPPPAHRLAELLDTAEEAATAGQPVRIDLIGDSGYIRRWNTPSIDFAELPSAQNYRVTVRAAGRIAGQVTLRLDPAHYPRGRQAESMNPRPIVTPTQTLGGDPMVQLIIAMQQQAAQMFGSMMQVMGAQRGPDLAQLVALTERREDPTKMFDLAERLASRLDSGGGTAAPSWIGEVAKALAPAVMQALKQPPAPPTPQAQRRPEPRPQLPAAPAPALEGSPAAPPPNVGDLGHITGALAELVTVIRAVCAIPRAGAATIAAAVADFASTQDDATVDAILATSDAELVSFVIEAAPELASRRQDLTEAAEGIRVALSDDDQDDDQDQDTTPLVILGQGDSTTTIPATTRK